jgi:hypothetical protein
MIAAALVVLLQVSPAPLVPLPPPPAPVPAASAAEERGGAHWVVTTPIMSAFLGAGVGVVAVGATPVAPGDRTAAYGTGTLVGAGIGAGVGLLAGWLAREGYVGGKAASISLWGLGGATILVAIASVIASVLASAVNNAAIS